MILHFKHVCVSPLNFCLIWRNLVRGLSLVGYFAPQWRMAMAALVRGRGARSRRLPKWPFSG
jgi:hypothetical protein